MKHAIVAEPDRGRFATIENTVKAEFDVELKQAVSADDVFSCRRELGTELVVVLLTDNFAQDLPLSKRFDEVWEPGAQMGYLYDDPAKNLEDAIHSPQLTLPFPHDEVSRKRFIEKLESIFYYQRLRQVTLDVDALLREQVRSLDRDGNMENALRRLRVLALGFFLDDFKVYRLRSGLSGASVFKIALPDKTEYLLKLSREPWKLELEARKHEQVVSGISQREAKPYIKKPREKSTHEGFVFTGLGGLSAICFSFLGGNGFGPSWDLQAMLTVAAERLPKHEQILNCRKNALTMLMRWLRQTWHSGSQISRLSARPWDPKSFADARDYPTLPPYTLTIASKTRVLEFLFSPEAELGRRLLGRKWDLLTDRVQRFVEVETAPCGVPLLDNRISMVHSPAHGDLNANNVLFFPQFVDPVFLIDFPMYQQCGHALQDYARLETEIKYALMDRQDDSDPVALPGLDFSPQQFPLWCELEDHLCRQWQSEARWIAGGYTNNVTLTLDLIQILRTAAKEVQESALNLPPSVDFSKEYLIPLLYHTLRAITFPSLSPFKRILAVYSAASILAEFEYV